MTDIEQYNPGKITVMIRLSRDFDVTSRNKQIRDIAVGRFNGWFHQDGLTAIRCTNIKWGGLQHADDVRNTAENWDNILNQKIYIDDFNEKNPDDMTSFLSPDTRHDIQRYPSQYATCLVTAAIIV